MARRIRSARLPAAVRRDLTVAAAVAREAVVELHVVRALELIRHADGQVGDMRMLVIYLRLHDLSGADGDSVGTRVLAALGRQPGAAEARALAKTDAPDQEAPAEHSVLRLLRRKLRGRVHDTLRRTVELHTGVVQAALLDIHVHHAKGFVDLLAEVYGITEACALYTEMVPVPSGLAGVLYPLVLDRIAARELSTAWPAAAHAAHASGASEDSPSLPLTGRAAYGPHRARHPA